MPLPADCPVRVDMFAWTCTQDGYFSKTRLQCLGDGPPDFGGAVAWRARLEAGQAEKFGYEPGKVGLLRVPTDRPGLSALAQIRAEMKADEAC